MTRAEEAALEAYPDNEVLFFAQDADGKNHPVTTFGREINGFIFGYEQAEKDTIERAIVWLKEHADSYIVDLTPTYPDAPQNIIIGGMCWEHLKQALEDAK